MGTFSNLIDISSFFIGVLINLLLVALICYYFKRKIDNLEMAQSEQAKMLFSIISNQQSGQIHQLQMQNVSEETNGPGSSMLNSLDLTQLVSSQSEDENQPKYEIVHDDEISDDESDEENESDDEDDTNEEVDSDREIESNPYDEVDTTSMEVICDPETKTVEYEHVVEYDKMTIKELKELLVQNGHNNIRKNAKKQDLINMLQEKQEEVLEVSKETDVLSTDVYIGSHEHENIEDISSTDDMEIQM